MKKLFLIFALVLTVGMNAWAGDYVATDYLNNDSRTRITRSPSYDDPNFTIYMFLKDTENGGGVSWDATEVEPGHQGPAIYIDGEYFASPLYEMSWLSENLDNTVNSWWDDADNNAQTYTKEINGVKWVHRYYDVQKPDASCYFVSMYFCPEELKGGSYHSITIKGYLADNANLTVNRKYVERTFIFKAQRLFPSNPTVIMDKSTRQVTISGSLASGEVHPTHFGMSMDGKAGDKFIPNSELENSKDLEYSTSFSGITYTMPENTEDVNYEDAVILGEMYRDFTKLGSKVTCHYYDWFNAAPNTIHYEVTEPTYTTVGSLQECWKDLSTGIIYSDILFENELNPAQVLTYAKFITNPVTANTGFTIKEDAKYGDVQFNWAAETTYNASETGTRSVEFTVYGTDVANARLKWTKNCNDARYGKFTITVYVNGEQKYSVNQNNDESLGGYFAVPLQGLNSYDVVKFEVNKTELAHWAGPPMIAACLEYTSRNGGERVIIHHEAVEPTYKATGTIEYWEDDATGKYYFDAECKKELTDMQLIVWYKKLKSNPVTAQDIAFTLKDATYDGVPFDFAVETTYNNVTGTRSVEFTVFGTDVANARLKWTKTAPNWQYGRFTITVYVNNEQKYSVNQDGHQSLSGIFIVPLEELKVDDVVKFEIKKPWSSEWDGSVMIAACLEYTSSNGGWNEETIHHDAVEPTYDTIGNIEYWEDGSTDKYYSDAACTQELNPIQIDTYKKLITNPVTANSGLTLRDITYEGTQFNWAAETTYNMWATGTRSVEFTVYGKDVDNARVKWTKNYDYEGYGRFTISIYVNGVSVYSVNQDNGEYLGGLFTVPLQDLKTGDVVKFEIKKPQEARLVDANPTIIACLEYTSSNGGFNPEIIITADDNWKNKGDDDPELTWKVTKGELKEGTELTIKIWREEGEDAGLYPIHVSQEGTNPKDNIAFVDGVFRIIDAIHHDVSEPMYETVGYSQECWEDRTTGKYYSDVACTQELNPVQVITYAKFISNPVTANSGFTLKEDAKYEDVQFNWAAETTYPYNTTGTRYVEFTVYGTDVANARVKWTKNYNDAGYGSFIITVYVNGTQVYSINQGDNALGGLSAIPLPDLKSGDKVKFEVNKPNKASWWDANPTITACLEYTSNNGGFNPAIIITADDNWKNKGDDDPELTWKITKGALMEGDELTGIIVSREAGEERGYYPIHVSQGEGSNSKYNITFVDGVFRIIDAIHHDVSEPTYETVGFLQECWEDRTTGKYYSDVACTQELNPALVLSYAKFKSNPVTAQDIAFTLKDATYEGVQFNWAAETTYGQQDHDTRSVEFTVYGTGVANAHVKWTKNYGDHLYGIFTISVYVNDIQIKSINQGITNLEGIFAVPLPDLKTGDRVRFEVNKPDWTPKSATVMISACLEYTSSNGGEGMLITANQDPDHTENYYSTFWSSTAAYQVPEGVTAYTGAVEGSVLKLTAIEDNIIPAGEAVVLKLIKSDNTATQAQITMTATTETGTKSDNNILKGIDEATTLGENDYALTLGQYGVGFYKWKNKQLGAHKAYMTFNGMESNAFTFLFDEGTTTGINSVNENEDENENIYNLNGVRVGKDYKGIVGKGGKKYFNK